MSNGFMYDDANGQRLFDRVMRLCDEYCADLFGEDDTFKLRFTDLPFPDDLTTLALDNYHYAVADRPDWTPGAYDSNTKTLTVDPRAVDDDHVLLHELIHLAEDNLDRVPDSQIFRDAMFWNLYMKLVSQIGDLPNRINAFMSMDNLVRIHEDGGAHDLLFFLKSLDIDLRHGWPLYTTFGYDLSERLDAVQSS